jgi:hypothetical protein
MYVVYYRLKQEYVRRAVNRSHVLFYSEQYEAHFEAADSLFMVPGMSYAEAANA